MGAAALDLLTSAGVAGVVVILLILGVLVTGREHEKLERENEKLREALMIERQRNADLMTWAATGARALDSLSELAKERRHDDTPPGGIPVVAP